MVLDIPRPLGPVEDEVAPCREGMDIIGVITGLYCERLIIAEWFPRKWYAAGAGRFTRIAAGGEYDAFAIALDEGTMERKAAALDDLHVYRIHGITDTEYFLLRSLIFTYFANEVR